MVGFLREKLKQNREFRSEDLQVQNQDKAHYTKSRKSSSAKSGNPSLATIAGLDLGFVVAKTVK